VTRAADDAASRLLSGAQAELAEKPGPDILDNDLLPDAPQRIGRNDKLRP